MTKPTADDIIKHLKLIPLIPEGGMFVPMYVSSEKIPASVLAKRYTEDKKEDEIEDKPMYTTIYYLLTSEPDSFSEMHWLPSDEVWHFYLGDPVELLLLHPEPDKKSERVKLGHDILGEQFVQFKVSYGVWMGAHVLSGGDFALMGTTMAPGYTDGDYKRGKRDKLAKEYPDEANLIRKLTRQ